jgi:hypothetical protein
MALERGRNKAIIFNLCLFFLLKESKHQCLYPLARIDYHPTHKKLHIVLNCEINRDFCNRSIPGGKELNLKLDKELDPRQEQDRQYFISIVCKRLGIKSYGDK